MKIRLFFTSVFLIFVFNMCYSQETNVSLEFPFSQFVIQAGGVQNTWKYDPFIDIKENEAVIAPPENNENWDDWYKKMKDYQSYIRENVNNSSAMRIEMLLETNKRSGILDFKRVLNAYDLLPKDKVVITGYAKIEDASSLVTFSLISITKGKEMSHEIERTVAVDSSLVGKDWTPLRFEVDLPNFNTSELSIQPLLSFKAIGSSKPSKLLLKDIQLSIPASHKNSGIYESQRKMLFPQKAIDNQIYERPELNWIKDNFIYNFAMLWDADLWDADKKEFTVDKYCEKMRKEFGGVQSVLLWFTYPNLGIDEKSTWDFVDGIPGGGIAGLKNVVKKFHDNNVKVFFSYMPWDIDTRRSELNDAQNWAKIESQVNADGLFFDTWPNVENFRDEFDRYGMGFSIHTELNPTPQNIQGYYAVNSSWGQWLGKYNNNGVSRLKWINPEHIQWTIARWDTNRQNDLAYSWINGQGVIVWENIFGTLNFWNSKDRHTLRKMNRIYQEFTNLYTSDTWKPYLPSANQEIHISSWENGEYRIWNLVADKEGLLNEVKLPIDDTGLQYYDLWNGEKLQLDGLTVKVPFNRFGSVIGIKNAPSSGLVALLTAQKKDASIDLIVDSHTDELSTKNAKPYPKVRSSSKTQKKNFLNIPAGKYELKTSHVKREGGCFPDQDAKSNNDLHIVNNIIYHKTTVDLPAVKIMPRVVTNSEFSDFLKATKYEPLGSHNFLKHWGEDRVCPDSIKDEPVVFVSLDDARAYAKWAGMRLPTEWEWQAAGEVNKKDFVFNEVWEWNESERTDGHNVFVTLRGGSKDWELTTSHWYFPGTVDMKKAIGGSQPLDSHTKYYIMKAGFDRASTLGFRCVK